MVRHVDLEIMNKLSSTTDERVASRRGIVGCCRFGEDFSCPNEAGSAASHAAYSSLSLFVSCADFAKANDAAAVVISVTLAQVFSRPTRRHYSQVQVPFYVLPGTESLSYW